MLSPDSSGRSPSSAISAKFHHSANSLALGQRREALVDVGEPDATRDELVEHEPAAKILLRQPREIALGTCIAIARAHDAFLAHERSPAERDLLVDVDLAEPHDVSARAHALHGETESRFMPGRFEDVVGA